MCLFGVYRGFHTIFYLFFLNLTQFNTKTHLKRSRNAKIHIWTIVLNLVRTGSCEFQSCEWVCPAGKLVNHDIVKEKNQIWSLKHSCGTVLSFKVSTSGRWVGGGGGREGGSFSETLIFCMFVFYAWELQFLHRHLTLYIFLIIKIYMFSTKKIRKFYYLVVVILPYYQKLNIRCLWISCMFLHYFETLRFSATLVE